MTNKMAIKYLTPVKTFMKRQDFDRHYIEAMELAIKTLDENQKLKDMFNVANDADDFWHEVRVMFEGE